MITRERPLKESQGGHLRRGRVDRDLNEAKEPSSPWGMQAEGSAEAKSLRKKELGVFQEHPAAPRLSGVCQGRGAQGRRAGGGQPRAHGSAVFLGSRLYPESTRALMEEHWGPLATLWRIDWGPRVAAGDLIRVFVKCRRETLEARSGEM